MRQLDRYCTSRAPLDRTKDRSSQFAGIFVGWWGAFLLARVTARRGFYSVGANRLSQASKALDFMGSHTRKGLKFVIADSALKRMQVRRPRDAGSLTGDIIRACLRTSGALNCNEWNDGTIGVETGAHEASLE